MSCAFYGNINKIDKFLTSPLWPCIFRHRSTGSLSTSTSAWCRKWFNNDVLPLPMFPSMAICNVHMSKLEFIYIARNVNLLNPPGIWINEMRCNYLCFLKIRKSINTHHKFVFFMIFVQASSAEGFCGKKDGAVIEPQKIMRVDGPDSPIYSLLAPRSRSHI